MHTSVDGEDFRLVSSNSSKKIVNAQRVSIFLKSGLCASKFSSIGSVSAGGSEMRDKQVDDVGGRGHEGHLYEKVHFISRNDEGSRSKRRGTERDREREREVLGRGRPGLLVSMEEISSRE